MLDYIFFTRYPIVLSVYIQPVFASGRGMNKIHFLLSENVSRITQNHRCRTSGN
jgi:hypothetical protein